MKNFLQIASSVNTSQLLLELHQNPLLWNQHPARLAAGSPHEHSDDIWIRTNDETACLTAGDYSTFNDEHDPVWYPAFYSLPSIRQLIFDLCRRVEAERIGSIFVWRVRPGEEIHSHVDFGWHAGYYDKFNICLQSAPGCAFIYEDDSELIQDRPGDVHRFLNNTRHKVVNTSADDYIVLCVCLRTHDYARRFKEPV